MKGLCRAVLLVVALAIVALAGSPSPKVDVPVLPTEKDEFGGRPGTFHFITNEQTMADAQALQRAFAAIEGLEKKAAALDASSRSAMQNDLEVVRDFAVQVHARTSGSAGASAAEVEQRLNAAKGKFMCGACHGHGMMHGGGMHRRGRGGPSNQ